MENNLSIASAASDRAKLAHDLMTPLATLSMIAGRANMSASDRALVMGAIQQIRKRVDDLAASGACTSSDCEVAGLALNLALQETAKTQPECAITLKIQPKCWTREISGATYAGLRLHIQRIAMSAALGGRREITLVADIDTDTNDLTVATGSGAHDYKARFTTVPADAALSFDPCTLAGRRVLCVDDDELFHYAVQRAFHRAEVDCVSSVNAVTDFAAYDVVLMDYVIGDGGNGVHFIREHALQDKAVVCSGMITASAELRQLLRQEQIRYLPKEYFIDV